MSVQWGTWNFDQAPVGPELKRKTREILAPYFSDGASEFSAPGINILYLPFYTTEESHRELLPLVMSSGAVLTWDGRLDNRGELLREAGTSLPADSTDGAIVAATYQRSGEQCFGKLVGDWALAIWEPLSQTLVLAKDYLGTRQLYYTIGPNQVTWCTILEPLVSFARQPVTLDLEYLARSLSFFPPADITPYQGISSVPPASFVTMRHSAITVGTHWNFNTRKTLTYRTDAEYEEHFRVLFESSVRRRLRSDSPVLAELSGGVDSSSIVCMADRIVNNQNNTTEKIDTVSYYDDSEPNWNERPYFEKVEQSRGKRGSHIEVGSPRTLLPVYRDDGFAATPGSRCVPSRALEQFAACLRSKGHRVVLSGVGGDEILGGVPTPVPELADLLVTLRLRRFARQLTAWSLSSRRPLLHLAFETLCAFLPPALIGADKQIRPPSWLSPAFARRHKSHGYERRFRVFGALPHAQNALGLLDGLREQFGCSNLSSHPRCERRYPFLDRDLLEFLFAIPREQIVRPFERRSLMRRSLAGIVPSEILRRKRKAFIQRGPLVTLAAEWARLREITTDMISHALGILDQQIFSEELAKASLGREVHTVRIMNALALECWLRHLRDSGILSLPAGGPIRPYSRNQDIGDLTTEVLT